MKTKKECECTAPQIEKGICICGNPMTKDDDWTNDSGYSDVFDLEILEDELIHKRMNDINTFQAHENELYLRGTDEYGKDFQICFDSYNFLEWIDTEHLKYIKKQLIKYIKTK